MNCGVPTTSPPEEPAICCLLLVWGAVMFSAYDRRHPNPIRDRAGRPTRGREAAALGLRRAAPLGVAKDGPGETGADSPGDGPGPRGVPAARRSRQGQALEQPRAFLCR